VIKRERFRGRQREKNKRSVNMAKKERDRTLETINDRAVWWALNVNVCDKHGTKQKTEEKNDSKTTFDSF